MLSSANCCPHRVIGTEERKTCYQAQSVRASNELLWQRLGKCAINHKVLLSPMCCCDKREKQVIKHKALLSLTSCDRRERNMLSSTKRCCLRRVVTEERKTCYQTQSVVVFDVLLWQRREKHAIKHKMLLSTLSSTKYSCRRYQAQCYCRRYQSHSAVVPNMFWQTRGIAVIKMRFCFDRANWNTTCGRRDGIQRVVVAERNRTFCDKGDLRAHATVVEALYKINSSSSSSSSQTQRRGDREKSKDCCYQIQRVVVTEQRETQRVLTEEREECY